VRETKLHEQILCGLTVDTGFRMMAQFLSENGIDPGERLYLTMRMAQGFLRAHWLSITMVAGLAWIMVLRLYYLIKPSLPSSIRLLTRRWWARRKRAQSAGHWPILECAGARPADWPGWPDGHRFAFVLTHDVESQRGLDRVKQLAELEMSLGFRSSFNLIPDGPYEVSPEIRKWLVERGFEVGVHDHRHDGKLYSSRARFDASAERINHYLKEWDAVGFRSGFMFHNLEWIKKLNVRYDASTFDTDPFEPQPDGVKTIFPFWVGAQNGRGYVELPYTLVQDSTLFVILQEKSNDIWKRKLQWIASRGGMALLDVHPDYVAFGNAACARDEFPVRYYEELLAWVKKTQSPNYWHALPKGVADFCRKYSCRALAAVMAVQAGLPEVLAVL